MPRLNILTHFASDAVLASVALSSDECLNSNRFRCDGNKSVALQNITSNRLTTGSLARIPEAQPIALPEKINRGKASQWSPGRRRYLGGAAALGVTLERGRVDAGAAGTGAAMPEVVLYAVTIACEISIPSSAQSTLLAWPPTSKRSV